VLGLILIPSLLLETLGGVIGVRLYLLPEHLSYVSAGIFAAVGVAGPSMLIAATVRTRLRGPDGWARVEMIERFGLCAAVPTAVIGMLLVASVSVA
jgi:hypothetical protein